MYQMAGIFTLADSLKNVNNAACLSTDFFFTYVVANSERPFWVFSLIANNEESKITEVLQD